MNPSDLTSRVSRDTCALGAAVAAPAAWLAGVDGALGAVAGAGIAAVNFPWLASRVTAAAVAAPPRALGALGAVLRLGALMVAVGAVLASGHAHPLALVAGLSALPIAVVAHGLRAAREGD
jgi:hypothetical protein